MILHLETVCASESIQGLALNHRDRTRVRGRLLHNHHWRCPYIEFPEHWTWHSNKDTKYWDVRKGSERKIGRVANVCPAQGELFYLRMLLYVVKGSKSFAEIRTIGNHECPTYRAACESLGLLGDDQEWSRALTDAAPWATAPQLRQRFVTMLLFCELQIQRGFSMNMSHP
ncbi:hypothetical protein BRADI_4g17192v3 [Brachypodium distachyon]|uniref:Uncharacterized protein n=1 Tax=Brachypodium distachyon TaxID=15368 RepID=A0A0Q3IPZ1_BRADI|nr:hypothetical protein BRADI_4g17192v3 [Brachypodium distachyon]